MVEKEVREGERECVREWRGEKKRGGREKESVCEKERGMREERRGEWE